MFLELDLFPSSDEERGTTALLHLSERANLKSLNLRITGFLDFVHGLEF
jgi:hypothetical protein